VNITGRITMSAAGQDGCNTPQPDGVLKTSDCTSFYTQAMNDCEYCHLIENVSD